jgi:secreted Zn-dependent insulinase-like peptidase
MIIREYFKNLYSDKLENLLAMDKFLDVFVQPKFNKAYINHLNRSITSNEIGTVIVAQQRKLQELMDSLLNYTRPLKKN